MQDTANLNMDIARKLFGFTKVHAPFWRDSEGTHHHAIPNYVENPAAAWEVWRWVAGAAPYERNSKEHRRVEMTFILRPDEHAVSCEIGYGFYAIGATWQEALCRAALALADSLRQHA